MLSRFHVTNYALLDEVSIDFTPGLNILTGETGAGKSILIGALGLILGERATTEVIRAGVESATVEGLFEWMVDERRTLPLPDLEVRMDDGSLIIRRDITRDGRSRCTVNGSLVTVSTLKRIGEALVDLHGQHEHQSLLNPRTHIEFLDGFGDVHQERDHVAAAYRHYVDLATALKRLDEDEAATRERRELYQFQLSELRDANVTVGEDDALEREQVVLQNAERLMKAASGVYDVLSQQEDALIDRLGQVVRTLEDIGRIDPSLNEAVVGCRSVRYQLQDVASLLQTYCDRIEHDPQRLADAQDRLSLLNRLKKKYGGSLQAVCVYRDRIASELDRLGGTDVQRTALERELAAARETLTLDSRQLSDKRRRTASRLEARVVAELAELGMKKARFHVRIDWEEDPDGPVVLDGQRYRADVSGMDRVEFLLSPNPGEEVKPLVQIASGGEISRIMLALKTILAESDRIPTLIFDEVDIGIGGRIAESIGQKLRTIAQSHQVLCITHLHQVACWGDTHYIVQKRSTRGRTVTRVERLDDEGRVQEIARMLAGEKVDELAVMHAREILRRASIAGEELAVAKK